MKLDNIELTLGMPLYDLALGRGKIVDVGEDWVQLSFMQGRSLRYGANGVADRFMQRTLYWDEPLVHTPPPPFPGYEATPDGRAMARLRSRVKTGLTRFAEELIRNDV